MRRFLVQVFAGVDGQHLAGNLIGFIGGHKEHRRRHIFRLNPLVDELFGGHQIFVEFRGPSVPRPRGGVLEGRGVPRGAEAEAGILIHGVSATHISMGMVS